MADGTLHAIAAHLARAVAPLDVAFREPEAFAALMRDLGWMVDRIPPGYEAAADKALAAIQAAEALGDDPQIDGVLAVISKAGDAYRAISTLGAAPDGVDAAEFLSGLGRALFEYLLVQDLYREAPGWFSTLESLGIIRTEIVPPTDTRPPYHRHRFDWDQIPEILSHPEEIPARLYGWGTPNFHFDDVAVAALQLVSGLGLPVSLTRVSADFSAAVQASATGEPDDNMRRALTVVFFDIPTEVEGAGKAIQVGLMLAGLPAEGTAPPGMFLTPLVPDSLTESGEFASGWTFLVRAGTDIAHQLGIVIRPDDIAVRYPFQPGQPLPSAGFGASIQYKGETPTLLFGQPQKTRLELAS